MMRRLDTGLDLDAVRLFIAVVEGGDFTSAAKKSGLGRSAVAKAIARLEARLGIRLLHRTTRRVTPTSDGMLFHERFAAILAEIDEAEASIRAGTIAARGVLRLSLPDAYGRIRVLPVLAEFLDRWPEVTADVGLTDRLVDVVDEGLDLAVRIGSAPSNAGLISRVVDRIEGVRCAAPSYLEARGRPADAAALVDHDLLVFASGTGSTASDVMNASATHGRARVSFDSAEAIRVSALAGLGIAYLPSFLIASDLASAHLEEVLPAEPRADAAVRIIYPAKRHLPPRVRLFIDLLADRLEG